MNENEQQILRLEAQLDKLVRTQIDFQREVTYIRSELERLLTAAKPPRAIPTPPQTPGAGDRPQGNAVPQTPRPVTPAAPEMPRPAHQAPTWQTYTPPPKSDPRAGRGDVPPPTFGQTTQSAGQADRRSDPVSDWVDQYFAPARENLEKFIGENLIRLIGIIIVVLGVGIGAKYAVDNQWINPLMRIVFGYAMGLGLVGLAVWLKAKYRSFSAVLLSGGMAIMYVITYFAYSRYTLIDQKSAFTLMAMFTVFTVVSALVYKAQVIAHIGLVGAYAVPFLLSNDTGNYPFLFSYMAIVNTGILAISVKKLWTPIFYTSSGFTWLIFGGWMATKYASGEHFYLALIALGGFFAIFYATKVIHGVVHHQGSDVENIGCIVGTAFIFYVFLFAIGDTPAGITRYTVFFSYLAVASLVTLLTSYRFYGRILVFIAYPFTWLIFGTWFVNRYVPGEHFLLAAVFVTVFFSIYYFATLIYRLATDDIGQGESLGLILTNSFIFYGFGYAMLESRPELQWMEGLFTAGHALLHSLVAQTVSRFKTSAADVVQVLAILIITFSTIAIPVQFDGNTITLIWSVEAAALFWFGRKRLIHLFEYFSYPIMALAAGSLLVDWVTTYLETGALNRPLMNGDLVSALVFLAAFAFIYTTNRKTRDDSVLGVDFAAIFGNFIGGLWLLVLYNTFRIEVGNYHNLQRAGYLGDLSGVYTNNNYDRHAVRDIRWFNIVWQINYTMFFLTALCAVNLKKLRSTFIAFGGTAIGAATLGIFLTAGMYLFYELRRSYIGFDSYDNYQAGVMNIAIRYISYAFAAALLASIFSAKRNEVMTRYLPEKVLTIGYDALFYSSLLIAASCELINLMVQARIPDASKLGLSILWGGFALAMVVIGIALDKVHLRIAAIVLLAVTLIKLFLYDIADLPTIPKTILFITIGLVLLVVSFLYTKYKGLMFKTAPGAETGEALP